MKTKTTKNKSIYTGELPEGCKLCEEGAKLVLFVTGKCAKTCLFCPLSEKRKNKDIAWANERLVKSPKDILEEALRMRAEGAGITGGDPLIRMERTLGFISFLKSNFGKDFHIHLYTASAAKREDIRKLKEAGLDEIRFHLINYERNKNESIWKTAASSVNEGIDTGIEIPAVPGTEEKIISIAKKLKKTGGDFLNLNELEFSETNLSALEKLGYEFKSELSYAVKGSEETAKKVLSAFPDFSIHYCSSGFKDGVQLRNRLLRTAKNVAKDYEIVTGEGLLFKGIIEANDKDIKALENLRKLLVQRYKIPRSLIAVDNEKQRIETSVDVAKFLAKSHRASGVKYSMIEEYPTADRLEVTRAELK